MMQLVADLAGALAWPLAAFGTAFLLREALRKFLGRELSKLKAGPVEVQWSEKIEQAHESIVQEVSDNRSAEIQTMPLRLRELAKISPDAAIMRSFKEIEASLRNLLDDPGGGIRSPHQLEQVIDDAIEYKIISEMTGAAIHQLRRLRNIAAHDRRTDMTYVEALEYLAVADAVMYSLDLTKSRKQYNAG